MAKISGPLLDRIDMHIEVPAVPFKELSADRAGTSSGEMRSQVVAARKVQAERFAGIRSRYNGQMGPRQMRQFCKLNDECQNMLRASVNDLGLSARAHDKILRVARTIADLEGAPTSSCRTSTRRSTTGCSTGRWESKCVKLPPCSASQLIRAPPSQRIVELPEPREPAAWPGALPHAGSRRLRDRPRDPAQRLRRSHRLMPRFWSWATSAWPAWKRSARR